MVADLFLGVASVPSSIDPGSGALPARSCLEDIWVFTLPAELIVATMGSWVPSGKWIMTPLSVVKILIVERESSTTGDKLFGGIAGWSRTDDVLAQSSDVDGGGRELDDCCRLNAASILSSSFGCTVVRDGEETDLWSYSERVGFLEPRAESRRFRRKGDGVVVDLEPRRGVSLLRRCLCRS